MSRYVTKYKTLYKERTVYVPVYDDPFWFVEYPPEPYTLNPEPDTLNPNPTP